MTTRISVIVLLLVAVFYLRSGSKVLADSPSQQEYNLPKPLDTSTHKVIESVKDAKQATEVETAKAKTKMAKLEEQQRQIVESQRMIDSLLRIELASK